ncbi:hypothetical protein [Virgibacillus sp. SK37]|uniref:hypothetical protein n=1 Tax=Virgibacillus sp. SK37 TaxID=403957 RepID=UPI000ABE5687|nr:hypothetical protein [Virgibacillus sp. SK37]
MMHAFNFFALIPLLIYIGMIAFVIWFAVTLIKTLKEKNSILKEISNKLDQNKHFPE